VAGFALWLNSQGQDIALRTTQSFWHSFFFVLTAFTWALQSWFWARLALAGHFVRKDVEPERETEDRWRLPSRKECKEGKATEELTLKELKELCYLARLVDWAPRLIGITAFVLVGLSLLRVRHDALLWNAWSYWLLFLAFLLAAVFFGWIVFFRTGIKGYLEQRALYKTVSTRISRQGKTDLAVMAPIMAVISAVLIL